jgi:hypothetical protein
VTIELVANSLADLTKRENRFCHHPILAFDNATQSYFLYPPTYPYSTYPFDMARFHMARGRVGTVDLVPALNTVVKAGDRAGEDVIQGNVLAFDMKVYDPNAPIIRSSSGDEALSPNDPGFRWPGTGTVAIGEFVDMFYMNYRGVSGTPINEPTSVYPFAQYRSHFSGPPAFYDLNNDGRWNFVDLNNNGQFDEGDRPLEPMRGPTVPTYDSWSFHYEQDGINQDGDLARDLAAVWPALLTVWPWRRAVDQGTNGVDDDGLRGVDDPEEREAPPPYTEPLRGVKISIRVYEPGSRVVRQASVIQDFVPY